MTALEMEQQSNTASAAPAQQEQSARVNPRTLIIVRWMAIAGQLAAVMVVHFQLQYDLPMAALLGMIGMSAALNTGITLYRRSGQWLSQAKIGQLLLFDVLQLAVLLFLTGGLHNPFSVLIVARDHGRDIAVTQLRGGHDDGYAGADLYSGAVSLSPAAGCRTADDTDRPGRDVDGAVGFDRLHGCLCL